MSVVTLAVRGQNCGDEYGHPALAMGWQRSGLTSLSHLPWVPKAWAEKYQVLCPSGRHFALFDLGFIFNDISIFN